jgi:hypothetical protein
VKGKINIPNELRCKKSSTKLNQNFKKIIDHNQVDFVPGMQEGYNVCKIINRIYHTNRMKDKTM